jgi:hypothetical protein
VEKDKASAILVEANLPLKLPKETEKHSLTLAQLYTPVAGTGLSDETLNFIIAGICYTENHWNSCPEQRCSSSKER